MTDLLLLSKDTPIAEIVGGGVIPIAPSRLPLFLRRGGSARAWLESRAVDSHRTNSRLLKKVLRLEHKDDLTAVLAVNAATITDNYWVKPLGDESLCYEDVRFKMNLFDKLSLTGDVNSFDIPPGRTPELTNTGSFEKCWRLEGGVWHMYKSGTPEELFSELLACRLGERLGIPTARYEPAGEFISSRDFTDGARVDFEPVSGVTGDEADYVKIYETLKKLGGGVAEAYVQMCYFDGLILNMDRHENNYGVLRDPDTGEILSLAPLYDHNISLIARGYPRNEPNDMLISDFAALLRHIGKPMRARRLGESEVLSLSRAIPFEPRATAEAPNPREFTARYVIRRQSALAEQCGGMLL